MLTPSKPIITAFDFDGTLTYRDSFLPFLHFLSGTPATLVNVFLETPHLMQYLSGQYNRQDLKEAFITRFLKGKSREEIQSFADPFAIKVLPGLLRPKSLECIAWHKKRGHRCVLISANLDIYLEPWARMNGFDDVITSCVEFNAEDRVTGKLRGLNCRGHEKVRQLIKRLGPKENYILYAYGDSEGDRELLDLADYPFYRTLENAASNVLS